MSINEAKPLKDVTYDIIKGAVGSFRDPKELLLELERQNDQVTTYA